MGSGEKEPRRAAQREERVRGCARRCSALQYPGSPDPAPHAAIGHVMLLRGVNDAFARDVRSGSKGCIKSGPGTKHSEGTSQPPGRVERCCMCRCGARHCLRLHTRHVDCWSGRVQGRWLCLHPQRHCGTSSPLPPSFLHPPSRCAAGATAAPTQIGRAHV